MWLSLGGSSSKVMRGFGTNSFLGLLETSFILKVGGFQKNNDERSEVVVAYLSSILLESC